MRIRVFQIIGESSRTGAPHHLLTLVRGLDKSKFEVFVILPQGPLFAEFKKIKGVEVFAVPMRGRADSSAIEAIHHLITKYKPRIVHTHGSRAGLLGRLAARGSGAKIVYTEHLRVGEFKLKNPFLEWSHLRALKALGKFTDMTIAVSKAVQEFLLKQGISKADKITVIYSGIGAVSSDKIKSKARRLAASMNISGNPFVVGTVGSLNEHKDTATLLRAFQRIVQKNPRRKLIIVGDGPQRKYLERLAAKLGIEKDTIFTGTVAEVESFMPLLSVFVLPSLSESFGLSILEAMRAGVPVIATRVGGIPEIIQSGRNGLLVSPGNPKELAAAITRLANDQALQKKFVREGYETLKRFSAKKMVENTEKLYQGLESRK
jgi:glycosyltransferase involved in cell wall biosynthesis